MLRVESLVEAALGVELGPDPATIRVTGSWSTIQRSVHTGRAEVYRNVVVSLRAGEAVASCYVEPDELDADEVDGCAGRSLAELLVHPRLGIRIAALDAYLGLVSPHHVQSGAEAVVVPPGTSLDKSLFRARHVVGLLDLQAGWRVALIGMVNSLVQAIRERGAECLQCDFNVAWTEWGDPVSRCWEDVAGAAAVFASLALVQARILPRAISPGDGSQPRPILNDWAVAIGLLVMCSAFVLLGVSTALPASDVRVVQMAPVLFATALLTLGSLIAQPFAMDLTVRLGNNSRLVGTYFGLYYLSLGIGGAAGNTLIGASFDLAEAVGARLLPWALLSTIAIASATTVMLLDQRRLVPATTGTPAS